MGKVYDEINPTTAEFIRSQHLFFVATAPLDGEGILNLSPKGLTGTFAIVDRLTVAYLDLTGSGIETVSHLNENHRIVLMFCAFEGPPKIVRLHGVGDIFEPGEAEFERLRPLFGEFDGVRSIVRVRLTRISDSCGYAVPLYEFVGERDQLLRWAERKGPEGIRAYQAESNRKSIGGLPGLRLR